MNTNQKFSAFIGGELYELNGVTIVPDQISLFDSNTGVGGIGYTPYNGSEVTVVVPVSTSSNVINFCDTLNNTVYYLVSSIKYTESDYDTIISLATPITVTYDSEKNEFSGTFTFSNPNNETKLYLIWDYTDNLKTGNGSYIGGAIEKSIVIDYGSDLGEAGVSIEKNVAGQCRFVLTWDGAQVYDSGIVVDPGTINILFKKYSESGNAVLKMYAYEENNNLDFTVIYPYTTALNINTIPYDTKDLACAASPTTTGYFVDTQDGIPIAGSRIYITSTGTLFNGNGKYYKIESGYFILVDSNGVVLQYDTCACTEAEVPSLIQDDLDLVLNNSINVAINALNNPKSWEISTVYQLYNITGGSLGSIYNVTFSNGITKSVVVSMNTTMTVSCDTTGPSSPTLTFGDGTITLIGADQSVVLPKGITLDTSTGVISGTPTETTSKTITLTATNCVGTSDPISFTINVDSGIILQPFAIDVENFADTSLDSCAISPIYSIMYHDGVNSNPQKGDTVFIDYRGREQFMGGKKWYLMDDGTTTINIDQTGQVLDVSSCAIP